jgi:hypothetical protein
MADSLAGEAHPRAAPVNESRIITAYDPPPIPGHAHDWRARRDDYDGAPDSHPLSRAIGFGPTKEAAIADLLELEEMLRE